LSVTSTKLTTLTSFNAIFEISPNASGQKKVLKESEKRLSFETLLADLSARFINMPVDRVDSEIQEAQRRVCECLGLDFSALWQFSMGTPHTLKLTHFYRGLGGPPPPEPMNANEYFPWALKQIEAGRIINLPSLEDYPADAARDKETSHHFGIKSILTFPLSTGKGPPVGALSFNTMQNERTQPKALIQRLQMVSQVFINALVRKQLEEQLRQSLDEVQRLKDRLQMENVYLREEVKLLYKHTEIVGESKSLKEVLAHAEKVSATDATVLLLGETGTGKELLAHSIHDMSKRKDRTLVMVNCASLPPTLIESELFGREKGAYTGSLTKMVGRFELADGSTLFLDEIGTYPLNSRVNC